MKILLDQGVPRPLRASLDGHEVCTVGDLGWGTLRNGDLLLAAEGVFDVFVTTDQNLRYQQNLSGRRLSILVLMTTSWPRMRSQSALIREAIERLSPGGYAEYCVPQAE